MEFMFIDGSDISGLSKNSKTFIQYAVTDPELLLEGFEPEVFKTVDITDEDYYSSLSMARPLYSSRNIDLHIELVAAFYPVDTSHEFDKSVRFFHLAKQDSFVFKKPFTLFFDKFGRVYTLNCGLSVKEQENLYGLCVEVPRIKTDAYALKLYLIADQEGVVML